MFVIITSNLKVPPKKDFVYVLLEKNVAISHATNKIVEQIRL